MSTQLIRSVAHFPTHLQGGVLTIGHFDGVHVGHQKLVQKITRQAYTWSVPSIVMSFEPHAFEYFKRGEGGISRLTRLREKFHALRELNPSAVLILRFNQALASMNALTFAKEVLQKIIKPRHIIIGADFRFGQGRQGDVALLKHMGFSVETMEAVSIDGERVSSTRVREALNAGDHALALSLLGRPYSMLGRVSHGDQLGRALGFRTANILLHRQKAPVAGIYTVLVHGLGPTPIPGAANVGTRPTVDGTRALLEVHLLNFNDDIYGRYVKVEFCQKLRDEKRYDSLMSLKEAIAEDVAMTKNYFMNRMVCDERL